MIPDGFARDPDTIRQQFVMAASRRRLATQELHRAQAVVEQAEQALMRAEQEVLVRERRVELCDRSITALLDERLQVGAQG